MIALLFFLGLAFGIYVTILNEQRKKNHEVELDKLRREYVFDNMELNVRVKKPKQHKHKDPLFDEAKEMLVNMGYTATEAKDLLQGVTGTTAQEYVQKAMEKVKV